MAYAEAAIDGLRGQALALAEELELDPGAWYLRVLAEGARAGEPPDLGALVRTYWELQRLTGRADLRARWRELADALWAESA